MSGLEKADLQDTQAELLRMSRDLQESKARLEEAQRVAHVGYWIWNLETKRITWSQETFRIYGLNSQEGSIDLTTVRDSIHPEDRDSVFRKPRGRCNVPSFSLAKDNASLTWVVGRLALRGSTTGLTSCVTFTVLIQPICHAPPCSLA